MNTFNRFELIGRLAENMEVHLSKDKKEYVVWKIIINDPFSNTASYLSGTWFLKDSTVAQHFKKGVPVQIIGEIHIMKERYSDGGNKYTPVLKATNIAFLPNTLVTK